MKKDKKIPTFKGDKEAEEFVENADLSQYDLSDFKPMRFELERKTKQINLRLPESMLDAVKQRADSRHIPYQRFIREAIEEALH